MTYGTLIIFFIAGILPLSNGATGAPYTEGIKPMMTMIAQSEAAQHMAAIQNAMARGDVAAAVGCAEALASVLRDEQDELWTDEPVTANVGA